MVKHWVCEACNRAQPTGEKCEMCSGPVKECDCGDIHSHKKEGGGEAGGDEGGE